MTENARDFDRIVRDWGAFGERHHGVIFTSPRRYHRGRRPIRQTSRALAFLLNDPPASTRDWVRQARLTGLSGHGLAVTVGPCRFLVSEHIRTSTGAS